MATLSKAEIQILTTERNKQVAILEGLQQSLINKQIQAAAALELDNTLKSIFDFYNDDIIGTYTTELSNINGFYYPDGPIVEQDLINVATGVYTTIGVDPFIVMNRLNPTFPDTSIVRIPEFDGGNSANTNTGESNYLSEIADLFSEVTSGYSGSTVIGVTTSSSVNTSSTSVNIIDADGLSVPTSGSTYVITSGSSAIVFQVNSITNVIPTPTYSATLNITVLRGTGTVGPGASVNTFSGFNNTQRTNKTGSPQALMNLFVSLITQNINNAKSAITAQIDSIDLNQDSYSVAQLATAKMNCEAFESSLDAYLLTIDISDSGISAFTTIMGDRQAELTTRISQITNNFSNLSENYYEKRYNLANLRASLSMGTLTKYLAASADDTMTLNLIADAETAISIIDDLLS